MAHKSNHKNTRNAKPNESVNGDIRKRPNFFPDLRNNTL